MITFSTTVSGDQIAEAMEYEAEEFARFLIVMADRPSETFLDDVAEMVDLDERDSVVAFLRGLADAISRAE